MKDRFPNALTISLLNVAKRRQMKANPQLLRSLVEGSAGVKDIVIDEIQRVPELLDVVHSLMDEKRGYRFILTGSSARKLKRNASADLLGGRAVLRYCHPFMASELGEVCLLICH
ncbi:MAG: AAA family ATPase [Kiritimatiellae bacterium]|nr:AAA family ATPase [Kiritimatiellia bacterium]